MVDEPKGKQPFSTDEDSRALLLRRGRRSITPRLSRWYGETKPATRIRGPRRVGGLRELAWPRTISLRRALEPPDQFARPAETIFLVGHRARLAPLPSSFFEVFRRALVEGASADVRIEEIRGFVRVAVGNPAGTLMDAVRDLPAVRDHTTIARFCSSRTNSMCLRRTFSLH